MHNSPVKVDPKTSSFGSFSACGVVVLVIFSFDTSTPGSPSLLLGRVFSLL